MHETNSVTYYTSDTISVPRPKFRVGQLVKAPTGYAAITDAWYSKERGGWHYRTCLSQAIQSTVSTPEVLIQAIPEELIKELIR